MIALADTVVLMLASGLSRRFGEGNKLLAALAGKPLLAHAAALARSLPARARLAVIPPDDPEVRTIVEGDGFEAIVNPDPAAGRERSLRLGLARALECSPAAILVLLGDMPHVLAVHIEALAAAATADRAAISIASSCRTPPLILPAALARQALARPDAPVRTLLGNAVEILATSDQLRDYDEPGDFDRPAPERNA